jgi:uncharacterized Zn finger protein (UPF0148 family)
MEYMFNMKNLTEFKDELVKNGHTTGKIYKCPKCSELMFALASPSACPYCQTTFASGLDTSVFDFATKVEKVAKAEVVTELKVIDREEAEEFADVLENPEAPKEDVDAALEKLVKPNWYNSYEPRTAAPEEPKKKGKK